ncbi:MAG: N-acetylglucosamine-6-phosphate deacetylase [Chloracidobacterium sp.]|nr:N-acetylglucosamine-6-phosphate deacetylase [Chloracidobacterium sp.]
MKLSAKVGGSVDLVSLQITDGLISKILPSELSKAGDLGGEILRVAPGLIDIQINGYDGVDFNDPNTNTELIAAAARRLRRTGVTGLCPTIITETFDHISKCVSNLVHACDESPEFARAMIGIHLEGPFISPEDGPRGAHPKQYARAPDWDEFQRWQDRAHGRIRIITLSPEWPGAMDFIDRAASSGVVVAIGHTAATPAQIADAARAGAKLSTHLGNGSHAKIDRHPNYIWEQLANDDLWASFIIDGHHLPPSVVKCFLRSKGVARSIIITDAIAAAGLPAGRYRLGNIEVEVTPARRVNLPGSPYLAGSVLEMPQAVGGIVQYSEATLDDALRMASANPAELLGVGAEFGSIEIGRRADLILFRWDEADSTLDIVATIVNGEIIYNDQRRSRR